jgi:tellurite resistance protein TerC
MLTSATTSDWLVFAAVVLISLLVDQLLFGRGSHRMSFREAAVRSAYWIAIGLGFTGWVYHALGSSSAVSYLVAYLVEESLSIDNLFVFLVIFSYFGVGETQQHRALFWGIFGAIVMRLVFILAGTALLHRFHWMIYLFGAFLIITGVKLGMKRDDAAVNPEDSLILRLARRYLRTTNEFDGDKFFTVKDGVRYATPLFLVLLTVEFTDVLFAVDSVPAVLAISTDVYVIYSSNIFAILGLRALYFLLAGMMSRFHYLDLGLAVILVFVGVKMVSSGWFKLSNWVSLSVIAGVLGISIGASLLRAPGKSSIPEEH